MIKRRKMIENKIIINENNIEDNKIISKFNRDGYQMHPYHLVDNSP
jgi:hypothetical protein